MRSANVNTFDLNLVKVFLAIWETRSLTVAGDRLGLTQPAVSHALRRLRDQFADPLFTRIGNAMVPTVAATDLYPAFDRAIQIVYRSIQAQGEFIPEQSDRTFRMAMSDISEFYFLPGLLARIEALAPAVRLESVGVEVEEIEGAMRAGRVDMAFGYLPHLGSPCRGTLLFRDSFVCLVRRDHPFQGSSLTEEEFSALTYMDVSTQATGYRLVDQRLHLIGARRRVKSRLVHFTVAPEIVRQTDLATLYPRSASERANIGGQFRLLSLPYDLPDVPIQMYVHENFADDPGIRWLGDVVRSLVHDAAAAGAT